jgi:ABC-type Fe3+/spermidine/putrescine transport system ATPase subunit
MNSIVDISNVSCRLGDFYLDSINLQIYENEYLVLLGPTGAGKTVLLESLLGLNLPSEGSITLDGTDVTRFLPEERAIGYIPQDYALFPNMTVAENIGYGPSVRKYEKKRIAEKVSSLMNMLEISHLASRYPTSLSGGEKQRVAVGRALAVEPKVLLLDEPLSALDETRRSELAAEFKAIQRQSGATFVHVCHNLDEACEVADRVAIMAQGKIVQIGTVDEVLYRPECEFVARFTGSVNVFPVNSFSGDGKVCTLKDGTIISLSEPCDCLPPNDSLVAIRPEFVYPVSGNLASIENRFGQGIVLSGTILRTVRKVLVDEIFIKVYGRNGSSVWALSVPMSELPAGKDSYSGAHGGNGESLSFFVPYGKIRIVPLSLPGKR